MADVLVFESPGSFIIALSHGEILTNSHVSFAENIHLGPQGLKMIAKALTSKKCPEGLQLNLQDKWLNFSAAKCLARALKSGKCHPNLQLNLSHNRIGVEGAKAITSALRSGKCPDGLKIYLNQNHLGNKITRLIADALQSGKCPHGLYLNLACNNIDDEGAKFIADALKSGKCPPGLTINLTANMISAAGSKIILDVLQAKKELAELQVNLKLENTDGVNSAFQSTTFTKQRQFNPFIENFTHMELFFPLAQDCLSPEQLPQQPEANVFQLYCQKLDNHITHLENAKYRGTAYQNLQQALVALKKTADAQFATEWKTGKYFTLEECWQNSSINPVINKTVLFLDEFLDKNSLCPKLELIKNYEKSMYPYKTLKTIGKCIGIIIIAALCALTGVAFGIGVGLFMSGSIGSAAITTTFTTLFTGTAGGKIGGITVCALIGGICGGAAACVKFFKPSPIEEAIKNVIRAARPFAQKRPETNQHVNGQLYSVN